MTYLTDFPLSVLQFYATAPYPCSYLPERMARSQVATPSHLIDGSGLQRARARGLSPQRRFHLPPVLRQLPRLRAGAHRRRGVPARTARSAATLQAPRARSRAQMLDLKYSAEHYALYLRYQSRRHSGGGMDQDSREQYRHFLLQSNVDSRLIEFREDGALRMVEHRRRAAGRAVVGLHLLRSGRRRRELRHLQHPVADRAVPQARPALSLSRLLDRARAARWPTRSSSSRCRA